MHSIVDLSRLENKVIGLFQKSLNSNESTHENAFLKLNLTQFHFIFNILVIILFF